MSRVFIDEVHAENILQEMWRQRESDEYCDVVLIAGTNKLRIPAHRCILSAASGYFKGIFALQIREELQMSSSNGNILLDLVKYCYTGRVEIREEIVVELLKTADLLLLNVVVNACGNFLAEQLQTTNCLGLVLLAEQYHCQTLLQKAKAYSSENFTDVCKADEFLKLNVKQLSQVLACDELHVSSEQDIFNSMMTWIEYDQAERAKYRDDLLKLVRMPLLEPSFLFLHVKPICTSTECHQLYVEAMEWHSLPKHRKLLNARKQIKQRRQHQFSLMSLTSTVSKDAICCQHYCPQRKTWLQQLVEGLEFREFFGLAVTEDNLYIVGGIKASHGNLNTVICLNLKTMTSSQISTMAECRGYCRAAVVKGFLYAVGGSNGGRILNSVEKWNPKTNTWKKVAPMSVSRENFGITEWNEKLYVVGGYSDGPLNSIEYYDPNKNIWKSISSMRDSRQLPGVAVFNGLLYAIGGWDGVKTVERYDPATDSWSMICSLSQSISCLNACTVFCNKIIVCYSDCVEEYNATSNKWELSTSLNGLPNIICVFSVPDKLLTVEKKGSLK